MTKTGLSPLDPSSFSRPELAIVTDITLNLSVNFDTKILKGTVHLNVSKVKPDVNEVILDTFKLNIFKISNSTTEEELEYNVSNLVENFGSQLTIQLPKDDGHESIIVIEYETSPEASGLQWIPPNATSGKKFSFLFSQFQSTHARSVIPCQDTPYVKTKYSATISAPQQYTVLMSAICNGKKKLHGGKLTNFVQAVPVPSYLIALAVGVLESKKIGPRSTVWAEKQIIEACAYEFSGTEQQLQTAESICGPYVWGIYDLLVLPPSFPYGGMENPCLTFVTPTLLSGDKSLANVIAHEIAHSWTGNLVTNRNFEHFWLNEGFTVFLERKIKGRLESLQAQDFEAFTSLGELSETVKRLGEQNPLTQLVMDLKGVHPDDAFSSVPYEKGHTFLRYLEALVGGPDDFEPFLRRYFNVFKFQSIETDDFKNLFEKFFRHKTAINEINWNKWLYEPGMPPEIPMYDKTLANLAENILSKFIYWDGRQQLPITKQEKNKLNTNQIIYILQQLSDSKQPPQAIEKLKALNEMFQFDQVKNAEIKFRWLRICIKAGWEEKAQDAMDWINVVGRMKYVRPLYRDLYNLENMKEQAMENFLANRYNMMYVTQYTIAKDLHINLEQF